MKSNSGMTLLELLVVMVLLSFVTLLMVQGVAVALKNYEVAQRKQYEGAGVTLASQWLKTSISGFQAELEPERYFHGSAHEFTGISHRALIAESGQAKKIRWRIVKSEIGGAILYEQPDDELSWVVLTFEKNAGAFFSYFDINGNIITEWPMENKENYIPSGILLDFSDGKGEGSKWFFLLENQHYPRPDFRDF